MNDPDVSAPAGTPQTGEPRVDEALRGVADLDDAPVDEHADRLGQAHAALQDVLRHPDGADAGSGRDAPGA